jgi:transposase
VRTAYKWLKRYREQGWAGLHNRCSRPTHCPHALSAERRASIIERRKRRQSYRQISQALGVGHSTIARVLQRAGLNRLSSLEPAEPVQRYEYDAPGGLLHLDIKKLGRFRRPGHRVTGDRQQDSPGAGWEYVHVAIDDHSRVGFSALYPDETGRSACAALLQALRYYQSLASALSVCSPTMAPATSPGAFAACAAVWGSSTSAPSPTPRALTARPSALSRRRCASGPMPAPMTPLSSVPSTCRTGCTSTTGTDPTLASATGRRSAASNP